MQLLDAPASIRLIPPLHDDARFVVSVPPAARLQAPLRFRCAPGESVQIDIGDGAALTIIEEIMEPPVAPSSHAVQVRVGDGASVAYIALHALPADASASVQYGASVGREASIAWHLATLGGDVQQTLRSDVQGEGGRSDVFWIFYAQGSERHTLSVQNVFDARSGTGEVVMKGVAEGRAHASARGMIRIGLGGGGTNTYLTQNVLMLDATAKIDAIPALEIKTNDVKASHSATVSRVLPADLFYFASRGIDERTARRMFVEGFLGELAGRVPDTAMQESVVRAIGGRYGA